MSFGLQGSFKFTWILEDIDSWFTHRDYVKSPMFTSEAILQKTIWCIYLHGLNESMREDSLCLNLRRRDNLPGKIKLCVSMFLITSSGKQHRIDKQKKYIFESGEGIKFNLDHSFYTLKESFYDEQLRIHCEIVNPSALVVFPEHFTASTRLGKDIVNCLWKIQAFLSFPTFISTFPSIPNSSHRLEIKGISWERNLFASLPMDDEQLHIKIGTVDDDITSSAHVEGEISLLNGEKEIVLSVESKHIFLAGDENKIWKFVVPFSKKNIIEVCEVHKTNGELSLLCKFTFYKTVDESLEYTILPRSCQNLVSRRAEQNPTSNVSALLVNAFEKFNVNEDRYHVKEEKMSKDLIEDIKNLYFKNNCCDVLLKAGTQFFPSHKTILCARSPVFKNMFEKDMEKLKKEEVRIELEAETMDQFLIFLYSDNLDNLQWESAKKLLHAANKFQVESLKIECCLFLKSQFCLSNICDALSFASVYQDYELKKECEEFIFQNASKVFSSKEWNVFALKNPSLSADIIKSYFSQKN
ncbi:Speckle-type POZ protein like [Argiope bruennichi]|uniref:Speckle-type POZ protein like n=1 Tax=Argiope bruennichi TaxID=94029 RepID=A0A8T0EDF9_ARGBR|nr:Speckle-type POZ protein like [Argiope bruennichi]